MTVGLKTNNSIPSHGDTININLLSNCRHLVFVLVDQYVVRYIISTWMRSSFLLGYHTSISILYLLLIVVSTHKMLFERFMCSWFSNLRQRCFINEYT